MGQRSLFRFQKNNQRHNFIKVVILGVLKSMFKAILNAKQDGTVANCFRISWKQVKIGFFFWLEN